jgi:hypothetical protein
MQDFGGRPIQKEIIRKGYAWVWKNIERNIRKRERGDVDWIHLAQHRGSGRLL